MLQRRLVNPVNFTGRSKAQIVEDMEAHHLARHIVGAVEMAHSEDCRCNACVQAMLDRVVASSERLANA